MVLSIVGLLAFYTYSTINKANKKDNASKTNSSSTTAKPSSTSPQTTSKQIDIRKNIEQSNPKPTIKISQVKVGSSVATVQSDGNKQQSQKTTVKEAIVKTPITPKSKANSELIPNPQEEAKRKQLLLDRALAQMQLKNWKKAVEIEYAPNQNQPAIDPVNNYQIVNFKLIPDAFQKMIIAAIAQRINFTDLIVTFNYQTDYKAVAVKVALKNDKNITKTLNYQLHKN